MTRTADVGLTEVGPRDGLQNEPEVLAPEVRVELIRRLAAAGHTRIEVGSFVSPKWIPQMAGTEEVAAALPRDDGVAYSALVPNAKGWERFRETGLPLAAFFASASETHNRKNVNRGIAEHLGAFRPVAEQAKAAGVRLRCYLSTVCGCPYEGEVPVAQVLRVVEQLLTLGADEISLGDTIGVGTPAQVRELVRGVRDVMPLERVALHFHDTWGRALANLQAGLEEGVRDFDASLGGLGGCPYAPGASGNVATEDVVALLEAQGVATGIDLDALVDTTAWLEREVLGRPLPGRVYRAVLGGREKG